MVHLSSKCLIASKVVRVKLEPESTMVELSSVVFAILENVLETRQASIVRQCTGVFAHSVVLNFPVDAVLEERTLGNDRAVFVTSPYALADVAFVAAIIMTLELA